MDPAAHPRKAASRARAHEHHVRHACVECGQAFTLHYTIAVMTAKAPARVPCMNDACGAEVEVLLPRRAYALWTEEY